MEDARKTQHFCELILKFRDGQLDNNERQQLNTILRSSPPARQFYIETVIIHAIFEGRKSPLIDLDLSSRSKVLDQQLWNALAAEESRAEAVEVERKQPEQVDPPQEIIPLKKTEQKPNTTLLFTLLASAAAIFLLIAYIHFSPFKPGNPVAVLSDSIDASWADNQPLENGTPLLTSSKPLILREGYAELLFDNQAKITMKGPAELQILDGDVVKLNYGQIYAIVPSQAYGFQICTRESKIIDLGTEFGIEQNINGDTEIHVLKGKVVFVSKAMGKQINLNLQAGSARKMFCATGETKEIACKEDLFVRQINSDLGWIWRGQPLDLADVVGSGNGFSGGDPQRGIDLSTGLTHTRANQGYDSTGSTDFCPVSDSVFIDGVFVPNGATGATIINTEGLTFDGFPETNSSYWSDITPNPYVIKQVKNKTETVSTLLEVEGQTGDVLPSRLLVHPNAGITFDLEKIRQAYPDFDLKMFRAVCGLPQALDFRKRSEFWVLVDGECVFHTQADYKNTKSKKIEIPLEPDARFLTLATTDGGDGTHYDWCVFAQPYLHMERHTN